MNRETLFHFLGATLETLGSLRNLTADGKLHAFSGNNSATTGYYRITEDSKESSFTVDYFHKGFEGSANITFLIDHAGVSQCH